MKNIKWIRGLVLLAILLVGCQSPESKNNAPVKNSEEVKNVQEEKEVKEPEEGSKNAIQQEEKVQTPSAEEISQNGEAKTVGDVVKKHLGPEDQILLLKDEAPNIVVVKLKLQDPSQREMVGQSILNDLKSMENWHKGKVIVEDHGEYFMKF